MLSFSDDIFNLFVQKKQRYPKSIKEKIGRIKLFTGNVGLLVAVISIIFSSKDKTNYIVIELITFLS